MKSFFFLVFFTFSFLLSAQIAKESLLWEIRNPSNNQISYLFGTMHIMDQESFFFPKKLGVLLSKSEALCMEISSINNNNLSPTQLILEKGSFNDFFSEKELDTIHQWASEYLLMNVKQFDENFKQAKPFLVLQFILQNSLPENTKSQESELENKAKLKDIELLGLETIDQQLKLFDDLTSFEQKNMILDALRNQDKAKLEFNELQKLYLLQNLDSLYSFIQKDNSLPNSRIFLEERNIRWISLMKNMMSKQKVFFAVGAAHLAGPEGLIELLIKEGYQLSAIKL
jgi:uncharacterized protein